MPSTSLHSGTPIKLYNMTVQKHEDVHQTAQHLLQNDKSVAIWQDNQVFKLDHTWDEALVGVGHPIDLVLYQMWEVNMVRKAQPLDRKIFSRCDVLPPAEGRTVGTQLANRQRVA